MGYPPSQVSTSVRRIAPVWRLWLGKAELFCVAAAAPLLLFPRGPLPWVGLGLILLGWLLRGFASGQWYVRTPLDRSTLIIFLMAVASLYPSADLALSMPKFYGILLGLFAYYAVVGNVSSRRHFWLGVGLLVASIFAIAILGVVGTQWNVSKYPALQQVYDVLPRFIRGIQTSVGSAAGFHPNELGGTLAFLLPLPLALLLRAPLSVAKRGVLVAGVLLNLGVLTLSVSRSAFMGTAVAILVLVIWRWPRVGLGLASVSVAALLVALSLNAPAITDFLFKVDATDLASTSMTLSTRQDIWDRAIYMIEDFPFTGIGLNTFPVVLDTLYPSFLVGPDQRIPHAHNIFLQTAVDLGLGGLLSFVGLWMLVALVGWRAYRQAEDQPVRAAIIGLLAGVLSYLIYGITDAITLGAKPMVLLWLMLGLIASAHRLTSAAHPLDTNPQPSTLASQPSAFRLGRLPRLLLGIAWDCYWMLAYLLVTLAYAVVGLGIAGRLS